MKLFNSRLRYFAGSFQRFYYLSVEQKYKNFCYLQDFSSLNRNHTENPDCTQDQIHFFPL